MCEHETGVRVWALLNDPTPIRFVISHTVSTLQHPLFTGHCGTSAIFGCAPLRLVREMQLSGASGEKKIREAAGPGGTGDGRKSNERRRKDCGA
jgi:hypothetical protein